MSWCALHRLSLPAVMRDHPTSLECFSLQALHVCHIVCCTCTVRSLEERFGDGRVTMWWSAQTLCAPADPPSARSLLRRRLASCRSRRGADGCRDHRRGARLRQHTRRTAARGAERASRDRAAAPMRAGGACARSWQQHVCAVRFARHKPQSAKNPRFTGRRGQRVHVGLVQPALRQACTAQCCELPAPLGLLSVLKA